MPIITVTLKDKKKKNYDLTSKTDITAFKTILTKAINGNELARLNEIKIQLEAIQDKTALITEQLQRIPTPPLLIGHPTTPLVANVITARAVTPIQQPIPPIKVYENGETSFQALYAQLMVDMARYTGNIDHLICYSALVLNLFMHAATFTPHKGHGKAQLREYNHKSQLQYYRSQGNHPHASFFTALIKPPGDRTVCRLPFNEGFVKLVGADDFSPKFCAELKKINPETGYAKAGSAVDAYVITKIAHAGARKNNFSTLMNGMHAVAKGSSNEEKRASLERKIRDILPPTHAICALTQPTCTARINDLFTRFNQLGTTCNLTGLDNQLASRLLTYRTDRVRALSSHPRLRGLARIRVDSSQRDITCLIIRLYPTCLNENDTYREGVTNVLLSFFGGIVNHLAQKKGLHLHAERRQSLGFFRPTLTDVGCLTLRISLGLEPRTFDDVLIDSLVKFDALLGTYKFDQAEHNSVSMVFAYNKPLKEKEDGKRKPRDPDTYIRNVVRKDNLTFTTFHQAKAYIDKAANDPNNLNYLESAMADFLLQYVRNGNIIPLSNTPSLPRPDVVQVIASPVVNVLQNTLIYACEFVKNMVFLSDNEPLQPFSHVYLHSLHKLFMTCQEAQALLSKAHSTEASAFNYDALLLIENMLEYLISLDGLRQIRAELLNHPVDSIAELRATELAYARKELQIPLDRMQLFFTDSGQQAITTTLLTLSIELHGPAANGVNYDADIHLFGKSYYEVAEFIKDCKKDKLTLEMHTLAHAKIVFVDISQLDQLPLAECNAMSALVIDMTHHPLFDQALLKQVIMTLVQRGVRVVLVESSLKHAQLGLDKYQAGKIITIMPEGVTLSRAAVDLFEAVSIQSIHAVTASYLSMVNAICREKVTVPPPAVTQLKDKVATNALIKRGFTLGPAALNDSLPEGAAPHHTPI